MDAGMPPDPPDPLMDPSTLLDLRGCQAEGSLVADRYEIQDCLGIGTSSAVLRALDRRSGLVVAVKVANSNSDLVRKQLVNEEDIYGRIVRKAGPSLRQVLFTRVFDSGDHGGLRYLAFDLGGMTLLDVILMEGLHPLPKRHLREVAIQLIRGLHFLHSSGIVHTDVQPSNIILRTSDVLYTRRMRLDGLFVTKPELKSVEIYIIDFGDSVVLDGEGFGRVGAVTYRAPEVTLELPWTPAIDTFATGCILAELYLGYPLFHYTETHIERLALVERVLGPFPIAFARMVERLRPGTFTIGDAVKVVFPARNVDCRDEVKRVMSAMSLSALVYDASYLDLCRTLLDLDPFQREEIVKVLTNSFLMGCEEDILFSYPRGDRAGCLV